MNESTPAVVSQTSPTHASPTPTSPDPAPRNPAVTRCYEAWLASTTDSRDRELERYDIRLHATQAYFNAMPDLSGHENIRDFIACVAQGMLIGAIDPIEGPKLLYAAQVAIGALRLQPKDQKRPA